MSEPESTPAASASAEPKAPDDTRIPEAPTPEELAAQYAVESPDVNKGLGEDSTDDADAEEAEESSDENEAAEKPDAALLARAAKLGLTADQVGMVDVVERAVALQMGQQVGQREQPAPEPEPAKEDPDAWKQHLAPIDMEKWEPELQGPVKAINEHFAKARHADAQKLATMEAKFAALERAEQERQEAPIDAMFDSFDNPAFGKGRLSSLTDAQRAARVEAHRIGQQLNRGRALLGQPKLSDAEAIALAMGLDQPGAKSKPAKPKAEQARNHAGQFTHQPASKSNKPAPGTKLTREQAMNDLDARWSSILK